MLDKKEFVKQMIGLCEIYSQKPSEYIFDVYYEIFKDCDTEEFKKAVVNSVRTHKFNSLPKPADILDAINEARMIRIETKRTSSYKNPEWEEIDEQGRKQISEIAKKCVKEIK